MLFFWAFLLYFKKEEVTIKSPRFQDLFPCLEESRGTRLVEVKSLKKKKIFKSTFHHLGIRTGQINIQFVKFCFNIHMCNTQVAWPKLYQAKDGQNVFQRTKVLRSLHCSIGAKVLPLHVKMWMFAYITEVTTLIPPWVWTKPTAEQVQGQEEVCATTYNIDLYSSQLVSTDSH